MSRWFIFIGIAIEIASILITLMSARAVHQADQEKQQAVFEREIDRGMVAALDRLKSYEYVLIAGAGFFNGSSEVSRKEWEAFTDALNIDRNFPGVNGFGFIRKVPEAQIESFLQTRKKDGLDFKIKALGEIPSGPRYIIDYIQPIERNREALGLDIGSNPLRRNSAHDAMLSGSSSITDIIQLVQDQEKNPGFLMLYPVYEKGTAPFRKKARPQELIGWTYAPFVGKKIMAGISKIAGPGISFNIYDENITESNRIYQGIQNPTSGTFGIRKITVCDQHWIFKWKTEAKPLGTFLQTDALWILASGLFTSTGLFLVMLLLYRNNKKNNRLLNQTMQEKEAFLSTMSHEIRTPLHGVIGISEILRDSKSLDEESREYVDDLSTSAQTLYNLINNILDFSKIKEGKVQIENIPFQPFAILKDIEKILGVFSTDKNLNLIADADPNLWVVGDPLRIKQILINLVGNAIKFTHEGKVAARAFHDRGHLILSIEDSGKGINEEYLRKLFEPFTQEDASTSREYGGTGLGMAIVKELVDSMKGHIHVQSKIDEGCSFRISIPLETTECPGDESEPTPPLESLTMRVLLVEDNPINVKLGVKILEKMDCKVMVAENGQIALDFLKDDQEFDLILMDLSMPVMDGFEATKIIRARGIKTRIVAFSANVDPVDQKHALDSGMDGFIHKPIQKQELSHALHNSLPSSYGLNL